MNLLENNTYAAREFRRGRRAASRCRTRKSAHAQVNPDRFRMAPR
jgi:hypothetical protein